MAEEYFDCRTCEHEAEPVSVYPACAECREIGCEACLDETGKCVPCDEVSFLI